MIVAQGVGVYAGIKERKAEIKDIELIAVDEEGKKKFRENTITRNWQEREKLFSGIVPIAVL